MQAEEQSKPELETLQAFESAGKTFSLADILHAARRSGALDRFREEWSRRWARALCAEKQELCPDPDLLQEQINQFRYARDLVTAEECEGWLALRGLEFEDLSSSFELKLMAELGSSDEAEEIQNPGPEAEPLFLRDALLSDEFIQWSHEFAWRVALFNELQASGDSSSSPQQPDWAGIEDRIQALESSLCTPAARQRELANQRLQLHTLNLVVVEFPSESAAREAVLCAREDGVSLEDVALENHLPAHQYETFLGDVPTEWQEALISTVPGDVTNPFVSECGVVVVGLLSKRQPALEDGAVCERLDSALRHQHFTELETRHIRWRIRLEVEP